MKQSRTLDVINFAKNYESDITKITHKFIDGKKVAFFANNRAVADYLQADLTLETFKKLFELCQKKGVFDLRFCNHVPSVTFNAAKKHMTRKWPRDHMGMISLIEDKYCEELWPGLVEWAKVYNQAEEVKAFERVFKNPNGACYNKGVAHAFWQEAEGGMHRDRSWKMHQRIESHGELLKNLAKYSKKRFFENKTLPDDVIATLIRFTHYLYVQGVSPQSCGAWEEIPFAKGINWDNVSVVVAFEQVVLLIKELNTNPKVRKKAFDFENILCKRFKLIPLWQQVKNLEKFINESMKQVRKFYLNEFHGLTKRIDSSSVMLCAEGLDLSVNGNLAVDVRKHLRILQRWEKKLVHEFGAWRYNKFIAEVDGEKVSSCDSYLNLNYYINCDDEGKLCIKKRDIDSETQKTSDNNGVKRFKKRGCGVKEKNSAQWGLPLSYAAIAYGRLVEKLLDKKDKTGFLSKEESNLFKICFNKNQEFIKRTYGNISGCFDNGNKFLKADGNQIEPFRKPEAYQAVTAELNSKKTAFIPGVNDHLGWDAAKCYEASKLFLKNLKRIKSQTL